MTRAHLARRPGGAGHRREPGHRPGGRRRAARPGCRRDDHRAQAGRAGRCGGRAGRRPGRRRHRAGARRARQRRRSGRAGRRRRRHRRARSAGSRCWSTTPGSTRSSARSWTPTSTPSARSSTSTWWRRSGSCSSRTGRGWASTAARSSTWPRWRACARRGDIGAYGAAKAALIRLTEELAWQLGPRIRVNAVAPAVVRTRFSTALYTGREEQVAAAYPLRRLGTPEDVAGAGRVPRVGRGVVDHRRDRAGGRRAARDRRARLTHDGRIVGPRSRRPERGGRRRRAPRGAARGRRGRAARPGPAAR